MEELHVEKFRDGIGVNTMKVTGFTEKEMNELGSMEHGELEETVLNLLDERNHNMGTRWKCGYGVYRAWVRGDAVFVEIGSSCD